ncbi:SRPBCC family protein [Microbulbifer litoralis]|uniref:SRPBCC family protein n=1 Tax=Microbulbifer litoralis TaxID=2933965 RepID=UPI00202865F8|nr:SRPBCC family protein [Microbulbifer sp. GX H0434]
MRWILYILVFLALLVLAGFLFPRQVTLERSVYIAKPPEAVFPYLNNFRNFNRWSPWHQLDPETDYEYSGPAEGVGAAMRWSSENPSVGSGSQKIVASEPDSLVRTELDFGEQGTADAELRLQPQGGGTNVTWWFSTEMGAGPVARWMGLLVERMVGNSYQQGLDKLKRVVESSPAAESGEEVMPTDEGSDTDLPPDRDDVMGAEPGGTKAPPGDGTLERENEEPIEERH